MKTTKLILGFFIALFMSTMFAVAFQELLMIPIGTAALMAARKYIKIPEGSFAMALADYTKTCAKNVGGNLLFWTTEATNVSSVTIVAGEVTALTLTAGEFAECAYDVDTLMRTQEGVGVNGNITYTHKIEAKFSPLGVALNAFRDELADASACGIVSLVKDGNGLWWLVGYNATDLANRGLQLVQDNDTSGAKPSDEEAGQSAIILQRESGYLDLPIATTSTVAVTGITAA